MTIRERLIGQDIGGQRCEGLLAWDDGLQEPLPAVLVAPTIRGRTQFEDEKVRELAALGYVGLSIDLYGTDTRDNDIVQFRKLMNERLGDRPALQRQLLSWVEVVRAQDEVDASRVAAIGFCFGGLCVLDIARSGADVAGVVSFHGLFDPPGNTTGNTIGARILALHGWEDPLATPAHVAALAAELTSMGADWQIHAYGNTLHAFTNPAANDREAGTVYNERANRRSWTAMRDFLAELFADREA